MTDDDSDLVQVLPLDLPLNHQKMWSTAFNDGYICGRGTGYQEQNPYNLGHPLFDAWRSGWFQGVYDTPILELLENRVPKNLKDVLSSSWKQILLRSK